MKRKDLKPSMEVALNTGHDTIARATILDTRAWERVSTLGARQGRHVVMEDGTEVYVVGARLAWQGKGQGVLVRVHASGYRREHVKAVTLAKVLGPWDEVKAEHDARQAEAKARQAEAKARRARALADAQDARDAARQALLDKGWSREDVEREVFATTATGAVQHVPHLSREYQAGAGGGVPVIVSAQVACSCGWETRVRRLRQGEPHPIDAVGRDYLWHVIDAVEGDSGH